MDMKMVTRIFVLVALIVILGWDAYRMMTVGFEGTISYFLYNISHEYPIVPFLGGVVTGHLLWDITDYVAPSKKIEIPPIKK